MMSTVTPKEIKRLYKRFKKLDKDGNGTITRDEFLMIPELAVNPLVKRVISIFDANNDDCVNFKEFISALSVFNSQSNSQEKLECACVFVCCCNPNCHYYRSLIHSLTHAQ